MDKKLSFMDELIRRQSRHGMGPLSSSIAPEENTGSITPEGNAGNGTQGTPFKSKLNMDLIIRTLYRRVRNG